MPGTPKKKKNRKKRFTMFMFFGFAATAAIFIDSAFRIDVRTYQVFSAKIPQVFDGFKIIILSDLHGVEYGKDNRRLLALIEKQEPDLIALTGDMINGQANTPIIESLVSKLVDIAPTYFVSGNHDWVRRGMRELSERLIAQGAFYLDDRYVPITRDGDQFILCGVEDPNSYVKRFAPSELIGKLRREYPDDYALLLGHRNTWLDKYPDLDIDLVVSGHAHGGLIRLPFIGGVIGNDFTLFPHYTDGLYHGENYDMLVSRGLSNKPPLIRFNNNPHLPVVVLRSGEQPE